MTDRPNYYQLLGLESKQGVPYLSSKEVKQAYRRALLQYHPDKNTANGTEESGRPCVTTPRSVTVDDIALAYKTLSEPNLRSEYDLWLRSHPKDSPNGTGDKQLRTGLETVDLDDITYDEEKSTWSRSCRCGEQKGYIVAEAELGNNVEDGEIIVGCKGCSLWLRILFSADD